MKYKYENRITKLLSQVSACCGSAEFGESICDDCMLRIKKCSKLVKRGQMPLLYYVELIRKVLSEDKYKD